MSRRSKEHHYVPKVLQRQFLADGDFIWYSARDQSGSYCAPYPKHIDKCFVRRNYYTILARMMPSDIVEKNYYGDIDNYLGGVLPEISRALEQDRVPTFHGGALNSIRRVVIEMTKRTPEYASKIDEEAVGQRVVEDTLADLCDDMSDEERQSMQDVLHQPDRLKELGRTVRVRSIIQHSDEVNDALRGLSVHWTKITTHHSYILSSLTTYRIGNGGSNGLSNPDAEIWMPVSPKHALVLARNIEGRLPPIVVDPPHHVRQVNEHAARHSNEIASHSRKLIESLAGRGADTNRIEKMKGAGVLPSHW
ncbi:DUF4238 domain-containing protein [Limimaricola variabilis]